MIAVDLQPRHSPRVQPQRQVYLGELRGEDELVDAGPSDLIDRLLLDVPSAIAGPGQARHLALSEQDRVLAAIFGQLYGDAIECHVQCEICGGLFALQFSLRDLADSLGAETDADGELLERLDGPDQDGVYQLGEAVQFRLPTGDDLAETSKHDPVARGLALRRRCLLSGTVDEDEFDRAMELVGPLLDTDLEAACALCGQQQLVPFRMADFLATAMRRERPILTREVHQLARAYGWSRAEILAMPRSVRHEHVALILAELDPNGAWQ